MATNKASPPELAWPLLASPVKPNFFHEAAMTDCAPTARVPASAEIPSASPEAKEVNQQHRPAARGGKLTVGGVTSAHFGCAHFLIQEKRATMRP